MKTNMISFSCQLLLGCIKFSSILVVELSSNNHIFFWKVEIFNSPSKIIPVSITRTAAVLVSILTKMLSQLPWKIWTNLKLKM